MSDELRPLVSQWHAKLKLATEQKKKEFGDDAEESMRFFNGPYNFLYGWRAASGSAAMQWAGEEESLAPPSAKMTINKVAELVQIFGPSLYHRNPVRKVNPRKPPILPIEVFGDPNDPNVQMFYQQQMMQAKQFGIRDNARAMLLEKYLNYTPTALDLKSNSRRVIDEGLIKGRGTWWTEIYQPAGAPMKMFGSFYDTVDNLQIDPDGESLENAKWIARRCVHPYWEVERMYGVAAGTWQKYAAAESFDAQAQVTSTNDGDINRKRGLTNDLMVYYKLFSKMGMGGRLNGALASLNEKLGRFGDYCYLVICDKIPYPLNLTPPLCDLLMGDDELALQQALPEIQQRIQWPTPFWADDSWPVTCLDFHEVPRQTWPMSHIKPAMGELKFLNFAWSFLAGKVKIACRDFLAIAKSASQDLKDQIKTGPDYTIIEVDALHGSIDKVVQFLQHPTFNPEIYKVIEGVVANFERRTGLSELAYGLTDTQMRSAQEANVKGQAVNVRPDDMANKVEDAMTDIARKEALGARWHLHGADVAQVMGPLGAQWWDQLVTPSDPGEIIHSLEYRIEANSAKKPNKALDQENMKAAMQTLFAPLMQVAAAGAPGPVNALITAWGKSIDLDVSDMEIPMPAPPPPMAPPGGGATGGPPQPSTNGAVHNGPPPPNRLPQDNPQPAAA